MSGCVASVVLLLRGSCEQRDQGVWLCSDMHLWVALGVFVLSGWLTRLNVIHGAGVRERAEGVVVYGGAWYVYVYQNGFEFVRFRYGFVMVSSIHGYGV